MRTVYGPDDTIPCPECNEDGCEGCEGRGYLTGEAHDEYLERQEYLLHALHEMMLPDRLEEMV